MDIHENFQKGFSAKKSLGQNFLHAPQVIGKMIYEAKIEMGDTVLEVGPGKGALTQKLLETDAKIIAVEKDDRAIEYLHEKFKDAIKSEQLKILHEDILQFEPEKNNLSHGNYTIVANIPYYISGEFLRKFLEEKDQPKRIVVMLQKELAKRIVDEKGSILGISVKAYGNPKYVVSVPRKFFRPIPNVDSAVVLIENISKKLFLEPKIEEKDFFNVLRVGFAHKRKVLIKNLEEIISRETLNNLWEEEKWSIKMRPEELTLEMWRKITVRTFCFPQK